MVELSVAYILKSSLDGRKLCSYFVSNENSPITQKQKNPSTPYLSPRAIIII